MDFIRKKEYVYFIQSIAGGAIKIGLSSNPVERVHDLDAGSPVQLNLIGIMGGGSALENDLHEYFADIRLRREWFYPSKDLLDFIRYDGSRYVVVDGRMEVNKGPVGFVSKCLYGED